MTPDILFKRRPEVAKGDKMTDRRVSAGDAQEDQFTGILESLTAKIPSSLFLGAAVASILGSFSFKNAKKHPNALFIGQWVAPFLILGIYNKMVKQHGSDAKGQGSSLAA
jgi:hypothetical protein